MWAFVVIALISLFSVTIIMWRFVMALIFVMNRLYLIVMALLTIFLAYFSFQIKSFMWDYLKPLLEIFVETLLVKSNLKAPTTAAPLPSVQLMSATPIEFGREMFESRLQEALDFLRDDSQGVVGIWGMGGVGKTTLLEHINNTLEKNSSAFGLDKVVFVTASRESTTDKIRTELGKKLGMTQRVVDQTDIFNYLSNKSLILWAFDVMAFCCYGLDQPLLVKIIMWPFVMALIFVLNHLYLPC